LKKQQEEEIAMKTKLPAEVSMLLKSIALILTAALALAGRAPAQSISWYDKEIYVGSSEAEWYQARLASDQRFESDDFVVVGFNDTTSLGPIQYLTGNVPYNETSFDGAAYGEDFGIGLSPSATMAVVYYNEGYPPYGAVVEVHQGGQRDDAALWSHVAQYFPTIATTLTFTDGQLYDTGYNASVATDAGAGAWDVEYGPFSLPVVEVHQAAAGISTLWYHVGTLTFAANGTPSVTWGPSYPFDTGYLPNVTLCGNASGQEVAIEVHEGEPGSLWYSTGVISGNQIVWNSSTKYSNGYAPSVTCEELTIAPGGIAVVPYVVEVHQAANPAAGESTDLWYYIAPWTASSVGFAKVAPQEYDTGCSPSLALGYWGANKSNNLYWTVLETHQKTCGEPGPLLYDYGSFVIP
jgi:hypothetical protein